jgi:hypothetical protein
MAKKKVPTKTALNRIYSRQCRLGSEFSELKDLALQVREECQAMNNMLASVLKKRGISKEVLSSIRDERSAATALKQLSKDTRKLHGEVLNFLSQTEVAKPVKETEAQ